MLNILIIHEAIKYTYYFSSVVKQTAAFFYGGCCLKEALCDCFCDFIHNKEYFGSPPTAGGWLCLLLPPVTAAPPKAK